MRLIFGDVAKKFYMHLIMSFALGFLIFLWVFGLYGILTDFTSPSTPFILILFTIFLILATVLLENRGVKMPYLLAGGSLLSLVFTFVTISVLKGIQMVFSSRMPSLEAFYVIISISTIAGFVILKFFGSNRY